MKHLALALLLAPAAHAADLDPFEVDGSCEAMGNCSPKDESSSPLTDGNPNNGRAEQREQRTADGRVILPPDFVGPPGPGQCLASQAGCTAAGDQKTADWAGRLDGQTQQDPNRLLGGPRPGGPGPSTPVTQGPQWTANGLTGADGRPLSNESFRDLPPDQQARVRQLAEQQRANCAQFQGAPGCEVVAQILGLRNEREETPRNEQSSDQEQDPFGTGVELAMNGFAGVTPSADGVVPPGKAQAPQLSGDEINGGTIAATYEATFRAQGANALQQLKGMAHTAKLAATQPTLGAPDPATVVPAGIIAVQNCPTGQRCD